jgi:hypothetical protein
MHEALNCSLLADAASLNYADGKVVSISMFVSAGSWVAVKGECRLKCTARRLDYLN